MSENILNRKDITSVKEFDSNPVKKIILALQHLIAMFGATVLVPILTGLDASVALVSAGVGTLMFHQVTKRKVPVFLGSSFAFIAVINTVKETYNGDLTYAQGGIFIAGLIYVALSFLVKKIGVAKIKKYLPAQVVGPMIIVIGLNLVPVAIGMASTNYIIAFITLGIALTITLFAKGFIKQLSILIAVTVGYIIANASGLIEAEAAEAFKTASYFSVPNFTLPKFEIGAIMIIVPVILAVFMEHIGDITTNGQVVGKNFVEDPGLNRTLLGDGLATLFAGLIGGPANTTYGENTGVLAITKNYDPSILRLAAVFAIALGFIAKVGGFLKTIPQCVMGGISVMLFSMIALIGVKTLRNNKVKMNTKNIVVIGSILIIGIGTSLLKRYTGNVIGIPITQTVKITELSLAAIVGVLLNAVLNLKEN
ncbi:uracil-xanthine permease family protein [Clostridiaceae bacterium M8S5]|nr:uracil-xanthine permease family protein [Clostridiaceae bacterium M8S5]